MEYDDQRWKRLELRCAAEIVSICNQLEYKFRNDVTSYSRIK